MIWRKHIISILLFLNLSYFLYAQSQANNWYFGHNAGISFNSGNPVALTNGQLITQEGCASISDSLGNLLFYTNGITVWNRNHQVMINGTGLLGGVSSSQSAVIVKKPANNFLYYIFTVPPQSDTAGLRYTVVDMSLQGGTGEIVQKNIILFQGQMWEKLNAVRHCNNIDVWIISRLFNTDSYYAYLLTASGISGTPVISNTGNIVSGDPKNSIGILKCSPNGKKIAAANSYLDFVEFMDFNNQTGVLSNPRKLIVRPSTGTYPEDVGAYGIEYSSDSKYLYVSSYYDAFDYTYIHQFDAHLTTEAMIQATKMKVDSQRYRQYGGMQLAPDGKIYVTEGNYNYLSVIANPNSSAPSCNFQARSFLLGDPALNYSYIGLPTFIQSYLAYNYIYDFTAEFNCQSLSVSFAINYQIGFDSVRWQFDDPLSGNSNTSSSFAPSHLYTTLGIYFPKLIIYKCAGNDTITKRIWVGQVNTFLGTDTTLCLGDSLRLSGTAPHPIATYLWNTGTTDSILTVLSSGQYWVRVTLDTCIYTDTININFNPSPLAFSLGSDTTICEGTTVTLSPDTQQPNVSYLWSTGNTIMQQPVQQANKYWLKISNQFGCYKTDTVNINLNPVPIFNLGNDTALCQNNNLTLMANATASGYLWNTGSISQSINVTQSGIYWVEATQNQCTFRDTIQVIFKNLPVLNFGNDTILCEDETLLLDAGNMGSTYQWQNNSNNQTLLVVSQGLYWARVTTNGCSAADTINVNYDLKPIFSLGRDTTICEGMTILLQPTIQNPTGVSYVWNNGVTSSSISITQVGNYSLTVSNYCGSKNDEIIITKGICKLYVPSAFTPNNDGLNDVFRATYGENIIDFKLQVYNRWGQIVFESRDVRNGWNGKIKGFDQPGGVYVWLLMYKSVPELKEQLMKGTVTLIR
jgi:gliding motility-associated-like protein